MMILRETTDAQDLLFLPRQDLFNRIVIKNESTNEEEEHTVTAQSMDYFAYASLVLDLKEGNFYTMKVYQDQKEVYYGKIFCTNQVIEDYRITDGKFVQAPDSENKFIIRE